MCAKSGGKKAERARDTRLRPKNDMHSAGPRCDFFYKNSRSDFYNTRRCIYSESPWVRQKSAHDACTAEGRRKMLMNALVSFLFSLLHDFICNQIGFWQRASLSLSLRRARLTVLRRGLAEYLYICHHQSPENNEQCVPSCFISHQRRARCTKKHNIYGLHAEWCGFQKISQFVPRALLYQKERCALMAVFISKRSLLGMSKTSSAIYREGKEGNWTWQKSYSYIVVKSVTLRWPQI